MGKGRRKGGGAGKKEKEGNFLPFYFSCSSFLNSADPTISEPETGKPPTFPLGLLIALDINRDVWRLLVYPPPFTSFSVVDSRVVSMMIYKTLLL